MKNARILLILGIVTNFGIGLFTNYASSEVPEFFRENPLLVWFVLLLLLAILLVLEFRNSRSQQNVYVSRGNNKSMSSYDYDIFLSYSHKDADWVRNILLKELEERGFKVAIDFRDIKGGKFTIDAIEEFVEKSKHVIAVFSPDYVQSEWGTLENVLARTLDPAQRNRKLIPVLYRDTKLSLSIRAINYVDFREPTAQKWDQLIQSIM